MIAQSNVSYDDLTTMMALSIWIYDYGRNVKPSDSVSSFSYGIQSAHLNRDSAEALERVLETQKTGHVVKYIDDITNGMQCIITLNPSAKKINVTFRGSDDLVSWLMGWKAFKIHLFNTIYVHSGILDLIDVHQTVLFRTIDNLLMANPTYDIVITGHSTGGALATLFGYLIADRIQNSLTKVKIITFGSPRVGSFNFRRAVEMLPNLTCVRVTNNRDLYTALPICFYYHVGSTVVHLQKSGFKVYENYAYSLWRFSLFQCHCASDHSVASYWTALRHNTSGTADSGTSYITDSSSSARSSEVLGMRELLLPAAGGVQMY